MRSLIKILVDTSLSTYEVLYIWPIGGPITGSRILITVIMIMLPIMMITSYCVMFIFIILSDVK